MMMAIAVEAETDVRLVLAYGFACRIARIAHTRP
jgi:hypothetical protein